MSETTPSGWKRTTFKSICRSLVNGGTPDTGNGKYWGGNTPWVTGADFISSGIGEIRRYVSEAGVRSSSTNIVRAGNLLLVTRTGVGKLAIAPSDIAISQDITGIYLDENEADSGFVYFLMKQGVEDLKKRNQGTSINGIIRSDLEGYVVKIPCSLTEQKRIASILATLESAIEKTEALIAKYQQIKAGLMHDLFTCGVTADGKLRPPREQAPELYQETKIGWVPKEWGAPRIGDIFDIQLGKMLNKLAKTGKWMTPYLGNRAVQWDFVDCSAIEEMDFSPTEREKYSLIPGDLLVCEGGDVGRTAMWRGELEVCYFQKAIHRLRPKSNRALSTFMLRYMRFAKESGYFREFTSQSSIAHLTQEKLGAIPMLLPKPDEQYLIAERFDAIDRLIQNEQSNLSKLHQKKLGLMHDLLTGKVRAKIHGQENTI